MNLIIEKDYEAMSRRAAVEILGHLCKKGRVNFAPTAGTTPVRIYEILAEFLKGTKLGSSDNIFYYQQDELLVDNDPSISFMYSEISSMLFSKAGIKDSQIVKLNRESYVNLPKEVEKNGGFDLVLMGLGNDGHIGANMPNTPFGVASYLNYFKDDEKELIASMFKSPLPNCYVALGMETLLKAKHLILIVSGSKKAEILKEALYGPICELVPASLLRVHPNLTVICDEDSAIYLEVDND